MCANYTPVTDRERERLYFSLEHRDLFPDETWPGYLAPFIRQSRDALEHRREACGGLFGLIPYWAKDLTIGRHTYNARSETAAEKPSFRDAWRQGRRCIVPAESFFEPNYESGRAVRWRIGRADGAPMGLAGLWNAWRAPDGRERLSFTMLTINADSHPLMRRFHKPEDEKRSVVVLPQAAYDAWLDAPAARMHDFLRDSGIELTARPAPLVRRGR